MSRNTQPERPISRLRVISRLAADALIVAAFLGPGLGAIIYNRVHPSYESALGVAYAAMFGFAAGMLTTALVALVGWRFPILRPHMLVAALSALAAFVLFILGDQGMLSRV